MLKHFDAQVKEDNIKLNLYRNADNFINLTGLTKFSQMRQMSDKLKVTVHNPPIGFCVDCCFFLLKGGSFCFNIRKLYYLLKENKKYFCSYEPELFPG